MTGRFFGLTVLVFLLFIPFSVEADEKRPIKITSDFPGGNILVDSIDADQIKLRQDLRDTEGFWFYWMFRIENAAGRQLHFQFTAGDVIGARGPAVSSDGANTWRWLSDKPGFARNRFDYAFGPDENDVFFAFAIPYTQRHWDAFLAPILPKTWPDDFAVTPGHLCKTKKGRDVPTLRLGKIGQPAQFGLLLTARNHACEMTADYVLEGILTEILSDSPTGRWFRANVETLAVPFVDFDGVEEGDQGKNRRPHDHNRDYILEIHPQVKALKALGAEFAGGRALFALDLHAPWIRDGIHEIVHFPGMEDAHFAEQLRKFSLIFEKTQSDNHGTLPYKESFNLPFGQDWNIGNGDESLMKCSEWMQLLDGAIFACAIELPFANASGAPVTPESLRELGRNLAEAIRKFFEEESPNLTGNP